MRTMRAPKGWTIVGTNDMSFGNTETRQEKFRREEKFRNAIRNIKSLKIDELEKEAEDAATQKQIANNDLLQAFKDKKLKSKKLIKKAKALNKRDKKATPAVASN